MKRDRRSWVILLAVCVASACYPSLAGAQASPDSNGQKATRDTVLLTDQVLEAGRAVFHGPGTCQACHGEDLRGGALGPSLRGPGWRHIDGSFGQILLRIREGRDGTLMVSDPGGINDSSAVQVATYVWAVSQGKAKP